MNMKEIWKQHQTAILCVVAILALAFPLISVTTDYSDVSITGFAAIENSLFALLLIILPFGLGASKYLAPLKKYQAMLKKLIPIFCILLLILVFFTCKSAATAGSDAFGGLVDIEVKVGTGAILAFLSYIVLGVLGFKSVPDAVESAENKKPLNLDTAAIVETMQEKAAQAAEKIKAAANDAASNITASTTAPAKKSVSINRTNELLALIEKLSAMKDAGVLTEEEFSEKKKALLEEI